LTLGSFLISLSAERLNMKGSSKYLPNILMAFFVDKFLKKPELISAVD